jgi:hypothetical protein
VGKRFLRSIVQDQVTVAAAGDINPIDLPVNPLSFLVLTLWLERIDEDATSAHRFLSDCFLAVGDISVRHRGEQVIQGSLADLTMLAGCLTGYTPWGSHLAGLGQRQSMSFLIPFTRVPYWHEEGFPATSRGNLRFHMNALDASPGTATAFDFALEACELIEDQPTRYLKYTTNTRTPLATGRQKVPLPIGNDILGILLFDGLTEITATEAFVWGKVQVVKDNVQQYYVESNAESLRFDLANRIHGPGARFGHMHASDGTAVPTGDELLDLNRPPLQYHYLDFDPLKDGSFALETKGAATLDLDLNVDSITGTPVARYLPVELVGSAARAA